MTLGKDRASLKLATANVVMIANAFVWYLIAFYGLKVWLSQQNESMTLEIIGINAGAIVLSGLLGTFIIDKIKNRKRFFYIWLASGIALSIAPLGLNVTNMTDLAIIAILFGAYFGLGMPATMGYHISFTKVEGRAKIGGITFLIIGTTFALTSFITLDSLIGICLILVVTRLIGLIVFHLAFAKKEEPSKEASKVKYSSIISNRAFLLYFIPWGMFTLINFLIVPIESKMYPPDSDATVSILIMIENLVTALIAVISGFVADKLGRKRLLIIGFVMLGIGYACIGLFSVNSADLLFGSIIYTFTDGVAWGIFYVLFLFTIWGDLAQTRRSEKFYLLGALPYLLSYFLQLLFTPYLKDMVDVTTIFSFASVFLFIAVLPLIYAPETLPEKVMKDRDLKSYLDKAQKIANKESNKKTKENKERDEEQEQSEGENSKEYDEARKLAEKYY
jgi:hypothetical protein